MSFWRIRRSQKLSGRRKLRLTRAAHAPQVVSAGPKSEQRGVGAFSQALPPDQRQTARDQVRRARRR